MKNLILSPSSKSGIGKDIYSYHISYIIVLETVARTIRKERNGVKFGKEELKLDFLGNYMNL